MRSKLILLKMNAKVTGFYLQADEVVHEKNILPVIKKRCEELLNDQEVEGLLFAYKHFWELIIITFKTGMVGILLK